MQGYIALLKNFRNARVEDIVAKLKAEYPYAEPSQVASWQTLIEDAQGTEAINQLPGDAVIAIEYSLPTEGTAVRLHCNSIGPFAVHGIRVFENDKGMFINMPSNSYTDAQGNKQYEDVFHPVTKEGRELLVKNVLDAYKQALEQAQTNSQTQSQTSGSQAMQQM